MSFTKSMISIIDTFLVSHTLKGLFYKKLAQILQARHHSISKYIKEYFTYSVDSIKHTVLLKVLLPILVLVSI